MSINCSYSIATYFMTDYPSFDEWEGTHLKAMTEGTEGNGAYYLAKAYYAADPMIKRRLYEAFPEKFNPRRHKDS